MSGSILQFVEQKIKNSLSSIDEGSGKFDSDRYVRLCTTLDRNQSITDIRSCIFTRKKSHNRLRPFYGNSLILSNAYIKCNCGTKNYNELDIRLKIKLLFVERVLRW